MSIRLFASAFALAVALAACSQKQSSQAPESSSAPEPEASTPSAAPSPVEIAKQFSAKSGRVTFELTGIQSGEETLTWDDWGRRQVTDSKTTTSVPGMPGGGVTNETRHITTPDSIVILDLGAKTAMKLDPSEEQVAALRKMGNTRQMSEKILEQMGATKTGTERIAGKSCDVWTAAQMGMTFCFWSGVALKTQTAMAGMQMAKLATKVEENVAVDRKLFEIPSDFTVTEGMPALPGKMGPGMGMPSGKSMPGGMGMPGGSPMPGGMSVPSSGN